MSTRDYNKHFISTTQPPTGKPGDEWYNPTTNYLYKLFVNSGTTVSWTQIPSTNVTGSGGASGATAINLSTSPTVNNGVWALDLSTYTVFEIQLSTNITSITIANIPAAGIMASFMIIFDGTVTPYSVVWPANFRWPSGVAPTITSTSGKKDVFVFFSNDGGSNWQAMISGQNL